MPADNLDTAQDITSKITSVFCSLSSIAIIAMVVSTDPTVRKGSIGVIVVWFILCLLNIIISSINAGKKGISLLESIGINVTTGISSLSSFVSSSSSGSSSSHSSSGSSSGSSST